MVTRSRIRVQPGVSNGKGTVGQQSSSSAGASGKNSAAKVIATGSGPAAGQSGRGAKGAASKVAYLEPIDFGKEIPTQPAAVGKLLHGAGFDRCEEITKIGRFRYKVDLKSGEDFTRLSKLNLTSANLKFFMPASQTETICFVRNVPLDFGDEEMKEQMECEFPITKVERIMRMGRNQQLVKTSSLKVTVQGKEVPRAIKIYGCGFRAELYIFPVKQCSLCWKFGHTKKGHGAADRNCPERTRRKAIVQEMVKKRIPFAEAEQALVKTSNGFAALTEVTAPGITETVEAGTSYSSAEELYAKIVKDKVNAVLLQEIWLKEAENFKMKNFKLVSKRRKEGYGGVGILLEEDFRYEEIDFPELGPMEVVGVKIKSGFDPVNLVSVYIPPTRAFSGEVRDSLTGFFEFLSDLEGECIIGADLNAHHESWSPSFPPCARGRFLKQQVDLSDLVLKNDKSPTTIRGPNENDSAVDITLVSPNLAWKTTWEVLKEENFGSIHCAIGITVSSNIPVANRTTKRINKSKLVEHLSTIRPQFIYSPEEMVDILDEAVEASSFVVANKKVNFLKKWWNDDINKLYEIKRQALANYNANKTRTNYIQVQKTRAEFKREVPGTPELLEGYGMALQDGEIIGALRRTKKSSAPGENKISYDVLRQLPLVLQLKISEMLSRVFVSGEIPPRWRITDVKPIPKKNADPELPNSRRPIALMNVEIKLINAAVKNRLVEIAEINNLIPELSFGFRKNRSASTCVAYVVNSVHEVKENNEEVIVAFLDVKMAYDSVNTGKLLQILAEMGIPRKLVAWLYEYLRHRVMRLETEEGVIEEVVSEGLPQGCPGAPIMYNLYTAALHKLSGESCKLVQFADDFAVIAKGASLELAEQRLNTFLNQLASKLRELDLEISAPKSAVIAFTGKRTDHLRFKIEGQAIEVVNTHVDLGFTMDRALRHRKHIEMVRDKGAEKLGLVKMLARKADGANPETLIKVGNAMIRSRMEYGASTYGNAANTHLNKLQVLQNSYIRVAMKYLKSTPVHVLLAETGQLPMKLRVEALAKKRTDQEPVSPNPTAEDLERYFGQRNSKRIVPHRTG
ncbi:hypothetical protein quinque_014044 [Culex quinquefasciatus]